MSSRVKKLNKQSGKKSKNNQKLIQSEISDEDNFDPVDKEMSDNDDENISGDNDDENISGDDDGDGDNDDDNFQTEILNDDEQDNEEDNEEDLKETKNAFIDNSCIAEKCHGRVIPSYINVPKYNPFSKIWERSNKNTIDKSYLYMVVPSSNWFRAVKIGSSENDKPYRIYDRYTPSFGRMVVLIFPIDSKIDSKVEKSSNTISFDSMKVPSPLTGEKFSQSDSAYLDESTEKYQSSLLKKIEHSLFNKVIYHTLLCIFVVVCESIILIVILCIFLVVCESISMPKF
jgi:hypothetical protein